MRRLLVEATNTELLLLDDGYPPEDVGLSWEEFAGWVEVPARPVLRLETHTLEDAAGARGLGYVAPEDDRCLSRRPRPRGRARRLRARGERGHRRAVAGAGALRLRGLRPAPLALRPLVPQAARGAIPRDAVRAPPLLPVRPRGGLARPRVRERLVRPLPHDPARLAAGAGRSRRARARPRVEAAVRIRRRPYAGALLPRRALVAAGARRGAARAPARGRGGGGGAADPARDNARRLYEL